MHRADGTCQLSAFSVQKKHYIEKCGGKILNQSYKYIIVENAIRRFETVATRERKARTPNTFRGKIWLKPRWYSYFCCIFRERILAEKLIKVRNDEKESEICIPHVKSAYNNLARHIRQCTFDLEKTTVPTDCYVYLGHKCAKKTKLKTIDRNHTNTHRRHMLRQPCGIRIADRRQQDTTGVRNAHVGYVPKHVQQSLNISPASNSMIETDFVSDKN